MLETDLDIALSQGKTIDAREFAEQLILRGQPFRLAFMDGKRNTNIPDCVVLSIADAYDVPRIEVMLPTLHPADPIPTVSDAGRAPHERSVAQHRWASGSMLRMPPPPDVWPSFLLWAAPHSRTS